MSRTGGEGPLVGFTLLGQAAAGMFLALGAARGMMSGAIDQKTLARLLGGPVVAVAVLLGVALVLSTRHLARPMRAWRAIRNLSGSWVSVEVLCGAAFAGAVAALAGAIGLGVDALAVMNVLGGVAAVLGVGFVAAMGQIYRLPARPAWDHPVTTAGFLTTAAWLGTLAAAAALVAATRVAGDGASRFPEQLAAVDRALGWLAVAATVFAGLDLAAGAAHAFVRRRASRAASLPVRPAAARRIRRADAARALLTLAAAALAGGLAFRQPRCSALEPETGALTAAALVVAILACAIGRVTFYAGRPRHGI